MPEPLLTSDTLDPSDMRGAIAAFPEHLHEGWTRGAAADALGYDGLGGVVVLGMGGSAIGGDLVRALCEPSAPVPFLVNRAYGLPAWVDARTLVVASSYSGGTEETLSAYDEATARGARVVAVTSGGELAARAEAAGQPVIMIPGGLQPRAALGYSLGVLLRLARAAGLLELSDDDYAEAREAARLRAALYDADDRANYAREISGALVGHLPLVYTGVGLLEPVGLRWRTQIHENAKHPAYGNVFPELNHNEIMGFEAAPPELLSRMVVLVLRDREDHAQVQRRFERTRELLARHVAGWREIDAEGEGRLGRMLSLIQLGDAVSFWLAARKRVDPTPVDTIQQLKAALAG
ncbi:MAG: bifunctional phosphoglucose/phosphomannose isomerase [Rubricoccaceae bacterium]